MRKTSDGNNEDALRSMTASPTAGISRRRFLAGTGGLALSLLYLGCSDSGTDSGTTSGGESSTIKSTDYRPPQYGNWQDLYREKWSWDSISKGTHYVNCWYQRGCCWNVYVKDGVVFREEQVGSYDQTNESVPDFNPRGCQKGACYSQRMVDASRVTYPMKRVGKRGEGKWKRVSWEEALLDMADRLIDSMVEDGPGSVTWDMGTGVTNGCHAMGVYRTNHILDTQILDMNAEIGDHKPGAQTTVGKISFASSGDDLFYSDLILIWGGNPIYTQIPNAHFMIEARYNGAHLVTIAPDYSPSSIHSDEWVPVEIGTDAALGLAMSQVMIEEGIYNESFIKEQTDLPILVRSDTKRYLRASDMQDGGAEDQFYFYDLATKKIREVSKSTLALEEADPALEGEYKVTTAAGEEVVVTPAFVRLRKQLKDYTPEKASKITGTAADVIRGLARRIAKAKAACMICQTNFSKYYHGMEMERVQYLVLTLAGQIGKKGSGIVGFPFLSLAGIDSLNVADGNYSPKMAIAKLGLSSLPEVAKAKMEGLTTEAMFYEMGREEYRGGAFLPTALWLYLHGGMDKVYGTSQDFDPHMKRSLDSYMQESIKKGWQLGPPTKPRLLFECGGNMLRRVRSGSRLLDTLWPKLELIVTFDWRMSNTAMHSDYVLPAAGWYEKDDITWATPISPFAHVTTRAVAPLGDSLTDWEFHCIFAKTIQERAVERGILTFQDRKGEERRFDNVYDLLTFGQRYTENNTEEFLDEMLSVTSNLDGIGWQELKEKGYKRYTELGLAFANIGNATDIKPDETITANTWHTNDKLPWPTLSRRIQFYIDQDFYLELGEELPVHKDNPPIGGDYPLKMTGGHTRWSIHASWRDEKHLLQLQRGEPAIFIGTVDAKTRGIADGEKVRLYNDFGSSELQAKVSAALRPGQVIVYHAWEPHHFRKGKSHQSLIPSPINPIQLAGGHFHLQPMMLSGEPGLSDRGTRVEVERIGPREA